MSRFDPSRDPAATQLNIGVVQYHGELLSDSEYQQKKKFEKTLEQNRIARQEIAFTPTPISDAAMNSYMTQVQERDRQTMNCFRCICCRLCMGLFFPPILCLFCGERQELFDCLSCKTCFDDRYNPIPKSTRDVLDRNRLDT